MKKIILYVLTGLILFSFTSCSLINKYKVRDEIEEVGDLVLGDGTVLPFKVVSSDNVTNDQINQRVAMIYKIEDNTAWGVGIKTYSYNWCSGGANAYGTNIETIQCTVTGTAGNYQITGDKNGEDNFQQISTYLKSNGGNDTSTEDFYRAFYRQKNYLGDDDGFFDEDACLPEYFDGWYLPTIAELYDIYEAKKYVKEIYNPDMGYNFMSSTQDPDEDENIFILDFATGEIKSVKKVANRVGAMTTIYIRKFKID